MRNTNIEPQTTRYEIRATSYELPDSQYAIRYTRIENPVIYVPIRHYICRESSTNQLLFMQNKPNFQDTQMNVSFYYTKVYKNETALRRKKTNPIKPNFFKSRNECKLIYNNGLHKKSRFRSPKKQTQFKPNFPKGPK